MTRIKFCGLTRQEDIVCANELIPEYIGFVFAKKSRRYISPQQAFALRQELNANIKAVGVFVDEAPEAVARLLENKTIDIAQLHGNETLGYIRNLRSLTDKPIIQAFAIKTAAAAEIAKRSTADYVLLDAKCGGSGQSFDWNFIQNFNRPYFLAGGLDEQNIGEALQRLLPYAVDVSSGIETNGYKDKEKTRAFSDAVRGKGNRK